MSGWGSMAQRLQLTPRRSAVMLTVLIFLTVVRLLHVGNSRHLATPIAKHPQNREGGTVRHRHHSHIHRFEDEIEEYYDPYRESGKKRPLVIAQYTVELGLEFRAWKDVYHADDPLIGFYDIVDKRVVEQHVEWCVANGIGALAVKVHAHNFERIVTLFSKVSNMHKIKIVLIFDSIGVKVTLRAGGGIRDTTSDWLDFERLDVREETHKLMKKIGKLYFHKPWYLRIDGKPVMWFGLARTWNNMNRERMQYLTDMAVNESMFKIGDHVFWRLGPDQAGLPPKDSKEKPLFDAYYSSGLFNLNPDDLSGHVVPKEGELTDTYFKASKVYDLYDQWAARVHVIPTVMSRFKTAGLKTPLVGNPESFRSTIKKLMAIPQPPGFDDFYHSIYFLPSFNEYDTGDTLEPSETFGFQMLNVVREEFAPLLPNPEFVNNVTDVIHYWSRISQFRAKMFPLRADPKETAFTGTRIPLSNVGTGIDETPPMTKKPETPECPPAEPDEATSDSDDDEAILDEKDVQ